MWQILFLADVGWMYTIKLIDLYFKLYMHMLYILSDV